jgi:ADP-heptose:LPS heptosyltransferase
MRLLFVELWRLGDAVSATAGLRALRIALPEAEIGVVSHPVHGDPLLRSPDADVHFEFDAFWTRGKIARDKYLPWTINYAAVVRALREVRVFAPEHVFLFRGDVREQMFFSAVAPGRISDLDGPHSILPGVRRFRRPPRVPRWMEYVSHVEQWTGNGAHAEPVLANISVSPGDRPYVVLHPGASWRFKQWSADNMAQLYRSLRSFGLEVRIVAGSTDREFIRSLIAALGEDVEVEYPLLDGLYRVIAGARAVICNNSAALHIAEALQTPCIALTGSSDPIRWGTYRAHSRTLIRSVGLACHPCGEKRCIRPERPCIEDISVADVLLAVADMGIHSEIEERTATPRFRCHQTL